MDIDGAKNACAALFPIGSSDYWKCVQDRHCGADPRVGCQLAVWIEQWKPANPIGNELGLDRLKPNDLDLVEQFANDLQQPNARVSATRTLQVVEALQAAGYHDLALQGLAIVDQIEAGRAQPRAQVLGRLNDLQALSRAALTNMAVGPKLIQ